MKKGSCGTPSRGVLLNDPKKFKKKSGSSSKISDALKNAAGKIIQEDVEIEVTPKERIVSKKMATTNAAVNYGASTSNCYDVLSEHIDMDEVLVVPPLKPVKPSPIIVKTKNVGFLQDLTKRVIPTGRFSIKILSIGLKLEIAKCNDFERVKSALLSEGLEFFYYHTPSTKPKKFVLKGLPSLTVPEVMNLLNDKDIKPEQVKQLSMKNLDRSHYILYFKPNSIKLQDLKKINCLGYMKVSWEHFHSRRPNEVVQCRNCQLFGHNSVNCSMKPKCLVCAKDHHTETCPSRIPRSQLKQQQQQNGTVDCSFIKCTNCLSSGLQSDHTANWKGCPKRLEYLEIQKRLVAKNPVRKRTQLQPFSWTQEEFPALPLRNGLQNHTPAPNYATNSGLNVPNLNTNLFSVNELTQIWQELFHGLRSCRSKEEQVMTLGNIIIKYACNSG